MKKAISVSILLLTCITMFAQATRQSDAPVATVIGYLRDSGCVHRFHEVVKPLPNGCVQACVRAGSPLVILTKDEQVFHPISAEIPDKDVRGELLPFAGKLVKITGHVHERGGSKTITVEHIEEAKG